MGKCFLDKVILRVKFIRYVVAEKIWKGGLENYVCGGGGVGVVSAYSKLGFRLL